jgi:hypothetical protein
VDDITQLLPGDALAYLRIADDGRRFPFRPISAGLYLIGHGRGCDLRLGGDDCPELHSVLQVTRDEVRIIAIASSPQLVINGEVASSATLSDNDLIEIGDVRCVFRRIEPEAIPAEHPLSVGTGSPEELISGVESELALIEAMQLDGADRLQELLAAAHEAVEGLELARTLRFADYSPAPVPTSEAANEYGQQILKHLQSQDARLDDVLHVLEQIVQQQQLMTAALQCLADRVTGLSSGQAGTAPRRASA